MSEIAGRLAAQAGAYFLEKPLGGRDCCSAACRRGGGKVVVLAEGWSATTPR